MPPKILIIRLSALGDVVTTLPLAATIKHHLPESHLTWVVEKMAAPLLYNNPAIDKVVLFPGKTLLPALMASPPAVNPFEQLSNFWQEFKSQHYDIAIDAQGLFKSGFLAWLSGAKTRIGFANTREWADKFLTDPVDVGDFFAHDRHIIDSYNELALKLFRLVNDKSVHHGGTQSFPQFPLPAVPADTSQKIQNLLSTLASGAQSPGQMANFAVLIPGTTWPTKIWPINKWQELGHLLIDQKGYKIIICGGNSEIAINKELEEYLINKTAQNILNLTGKTSLIELIALFERVQLVIGGDTGPLHLANAVGKAKIIGIFGSTPWKRNGPYGPNARSIALNLDCQPCFDKHCHLKTTACLNDLSPEYVYQQILDFIPRPSDRLL